MSSMTKSTPGQRWRSQGENYDLHNHHKPDGPAKADGCDLGSVFGRDGGEKMKKLIVKYREGDEYRFVNIRADSITEQNGFVCAYAGEELIGLFDLGVVYAVYLSEEAKNER